MSLESRREKLLLHSPPTMAEDFERQGAWEAEVVESIAPAHIPYLMVSILDDALGGPGSL